MEIIHVAEPFASGIAVFVKSLTENLPMDNHIIIHGERKEVMSAEEVKKGFSGTNVQFISWRFASGGVTPVKDTLALFSLIRILKNIKNVDAVHLHSSKSGFLGRIACRLAGIKNVIYTPNGAPFLGHGKFKNFIYKQLELIAAGIGGKVICCSQSEQIAYRKIGIKAGYINNGTSVGADKDMEASGSKKFVIANSGRIVKQKDPVLFNMVAEYFKDFEQFRFIWIGDGPERNFLTSPNIKITGWLQEADARRQLEQADVYLSTSVYEGLSFSILEAMSLQKPLILSDCIGNRDMVKERMNGDLFRTADEAILKILEYYNNLDMLNIMGVYSQNLCSQDFNVQKNFNNYRRIYRKFAPDYSPLN